MVEAGGGRGCSEGDGRNVTKKAPRAEKRERIGVRGGWVSQTSLGQEPGQRLLELVTWCRIRRRFGERKGVCCTGGQSLCGEADVGCTGIKKIGGLRKWVGLEFYEKFQKKKKKNHFGFLCEVFLTLRSPTDKIDKKFLLSSIKEIM